MISATMTTPETLAISQNGQGRSGTPEAKRNRKPKRQAERRKLGRNRTHRSGASWNARTIKKTGAIPAYTTICYLICTFSKLRPKAQARRRILNRLQITFFRFLSFFYHIMLLTQNNFDCTFRFVRDHTFFGSRRIRGTLPRRIRPGR